MIHSFTADGSSVGRPTDFTVAYERDQVCRYNGKSGSIWVRRFQRKGGSEFGGRVFVLGARPTRNDVLESFNEDDCIDLGLDPDTWD